MFKYFLVSIVIMPILLAVYAARADDEAHGRRMLKKGFLFFGGFWYALLYYLRYRWN